MAKNILKLIASVSDKKELDFEGLVRKCLKEKFPIYSAWVLIRARFDKMSLEEKKVSTNSNGWVNLSQEAKINELYEEIGRLRKVKLIDFPNIDKKWMHMFTVTAILAGIIVIALFFRSQHYVEKSEEYGYNINVLRDDTTALANTLRLYQNRIDSVVYAKQSSAEQSNRAIASLTDELRIRTIDIHNLEGQVSRLESNLSVRNRTVSDLTTTNNRLQTQIANLERDNRRLRDEMARLNRINFLQGYSVTTINNCRTRNTRSERLYFNTFYELEIKKFTVMARNSGNVEFILYDNNTKRSQRKTVNLRSGRQTVELGFDVTVGSNHYISFSGTQLVALRTCFDFPFGVDNLIRFTRGSSNLYPPFYDIEISANIPVI